MADVRQISLYDVVRDAQPGLVPHVMHKPAILTLSRRLERMIVRSASGTGVLFGSFQRDEFFQSSRDTWEGIASSLEATVVFSAETSENGAGPIIHIPTTQSAPLAREWAVLYTAPSASEGLIARELEVAAPSDLGRRFEVLRMTNPQVVLTAARAARDLVLARQPELLQRFPEWFHPTVRP
jgi:DICT domain-containing protein